MTSAPTNAATIYNTQTGEVRTIPQAQAAQLAQNSRGEWSFQCPLKPGWDREIPRYRVQIDLHPSPLSRHRLEPPFVSSTDSAMWQYAERPVSRGEELELTVWPHSSMQPLNETAKRALAYLRDHTKSRLPQTPWRNGKLPLDDGLFGGPPPTISTTQ